MTRALRANARPTFAVARARFRVAIAALVVAPVGCAEPPYLGRFDYSAMESGDGIRIAAGGTFPGDQSLTGRAVLARRDGAGWQVTDLGEIGALTGIAFNGQRWVAVVARTATNDGATEAFASSAPSSSRMTA